MEVLKPIIAKNIAQLRTAGGMTQIELAEYLNYSDKAVSKWERGESVPDVAVLKKIAERFDVSLDYLVQAEHTKNAEETRPSEKKSDAVKMRNHRLVMGMSIFLVWLIATLVFIVCSLTLNDKSFQWLSFLFAVPICLIVWLVFNSIWFNARMNYFIISLLMWSLFVAIHLSALYCGGSLWMIYLLGVPGQIIIFLWSRFGKQT